MNNMAPDLSGFVPYIIAFFAVAAVGAVVSLAIIAQAAATFVLSRRRTRAARPDSVLAQLPLPGQMEALIPRQDGSHGSIEEVPRGASGAGDQDGSRSAA